jgi:hypothetical protein
MIAMNRQSSVPLACLCVAAVAASACSGDPPADVSPIEGRIGPTVTTGIRPTGEGGASVPSAAYCLCALAKVGSTMEFLADHPDLVLSRSYPLSPDSFCESSLFPLPVPGSGSCNDYVFSAPAAGSPLVFPKVPLAAGNPFDAYAWEQPAGPPGTPPECSGGIYAAAVPPVIATSCTGVPTTNNLILCTASSCICVDWDGSGQSGYALPATFPVSYAVDSVQYAKATGTDGGGETVAFSGTKVPATQTDRDNVATDMSGQCNASCVAIGAMSGRTFDAICN